MDKFDNSYTYCIPSSDGKELRIVIKLFMDNSNQYAIQVNSLKYGSGFEELRLSFPGTLREMGFICE
jgi:hypothetical protein